MAALSREIQTESLWRGWLTLPRGTTYPSLPYLWCTKANSKIGDDYFCHHIPLLIFTAEVKHVGGNIFYCINDINVFFSLMYAYSYMHMHIYATAIYHSVCIQ